MRTSLRSALSAGILPLLMVACSAAGSGGDASGKGGGLGGAGGAGGEGASGGALLDGASPEAGDGKVPDGCQNVDILFVVDDSASMSDNQQSLINSFPGFISAIQQKLVNAPSWHVGVVTSDDYYSNAPGCQAIGDRRR